MIEFIAFKVKLQFFPNYDGIVNSFEINKRKINYFALSTIWSRAGETV